MAGAQFGIGSPTTYPLQSVLQSLQFVSHQIQQLQQLEYVQQQQLQQLQQWIQVVPQQIQQLQQQLLPQQSLFGVTGLPFQTLPAGQQFFPAQPGHVM